MLEDGTRTDIICNLLGVPNRLNFAQLFEQEINYISSQLCKKLEKLDDVEKQYKLYREFVGDVSKKQSDALDKLVKTKEDKIELMKDVLEKGIYLQSNPLYDTIDFWDLGKIYDKYNVKPQKVIYHEKFPLLKGHCEEAELDILTERPMIIGDMYYIRLKHDSKGKFSARSAGYLSLGGVPSKNKRLFKSNRAIYSKTALRLGEMEINALSALGDMEEVQRFISMYSSNESSRKQLNETLIGISDKGYNNDSPFDIEKIELENKEVSKPMQSIQAYLRCLGIKIEND